MTIYVEDKPRTRVKVFAAGKENIDMAKDIAEMYEAALGKNGIRKEGCEPYPDSDLFSEEGVKATLEAGERTLAIAQILDEKAEPERTVSGAMVMDRLSPHHVEFNSMAVRLDKRGQKIGSRIVEGLRDIVEDTDFTVNATELVTHSLASQAAHYRAGYKNYCGFGYCHYPRVFFAQHPESVLWVVRLQGRLVPRMRLFRSKLGRKLGQDNETTVRRLIDVQTSLMTQASYLRLSEKQLEICADVLSEREVYIPGAYAHIVESILFQFEDILDRALVVPSEQEINYEEQGNENAHKPGHAPELDLKGDYGHSYIIYGADFKFDQDELDKILAEIYAHPAKKRFVLVRIPAQAKDCAKTAQYLKSRGFIFHSYLPLYGFFPEAKAQFQDILTLQWVAPQVVAENALPGETESLIKLYGYPENLTGQILSTIKSDLGETAK